MRLRMLLFGAVSVILAFETALAENGWEKILDDSIENVHMIQAVKNGRQMTVVTTTLKSSQQTILAVSVMR